MLLVIDPDPRTGETVLRLDAMEWLRRVTNQIPDPRMQMARYYGPYANRCRRSRAAIAVAGVVWGE